jgi:hypothetical protein
VNKIFVKVLIGFVVKGKINGKRSSKVWQGQETIFKPSQLTKEIAG